MDREWVTVGRLYQVYNAKGVALECWNRPRPAKQCAAKHQGSRIEILADQRTREYGYQRRVLLGVL